MPDHGFCHNVTLYDGRGACSCSEAWREQCEAKFILDMPDIFTRRDVLGRIERKRGKIACDRLRAIMLALHQERRQ